MFVHVRIIISIVSLILGGVSSFNAKQPDKPYVSNTARLLISRGYSAVDHYVNVQEGAATISLTRATNPKITSEQPGKDPIVINHGLGGNANSFMVNIDGVEPRDHSSFNIDSMSIALNFGYEVWLVNRRPTLESQFAYLHNHGYEEQFAAFNESEMVKSLSSLLETDYWNFSVDEQAQFDLPEVIEYIIEETGREKLAYVGHSAGSVIFLGALISRPDMGDKISKALLWGPALYGRIHTPLAVELANAIIPFLVKTALPIPPASLVKPLIGLVGSVCRSKLRRSLICEPLVDLFLGPGASQQMLENYNSRSFFLGPISTHEATQLFRLATHGKVYPFAQIKDSKFFIPKEEPYYYDVSKIKHRSISLWAGNTDALVPIADMDRLIRDFTVPIERHAIGDHGILFNHVAFLSHKNVSNLLIIPSLKTIGSEPTSSHSATSQTN